MEPEDVADDNVVHQMHATEEEFPVDSMEKSESDSNSEKKVCNH
jgi:hypothetical protein